MRKIDLIILHCTASSNPKQDVAMIDEWHKKRGFLGIGYHYLILFDGTIEIGRSIEDIGAHCEGHNANSIGICLTGLKKEDFTGEQFYSLSKVLTNLKKLFPAATLHAHNEFTAKECPVFSVALWKNFWNGL